MTHWFPYIIIIFVTLPWLLCFVCRYSYIWAVLKLFDLLSFECLKGLGYTHTGVLTVMEKQVMLYRLFTIFGQFTEVGGDIWGDELDQQGNLKGESGKVDSLSSVTDVPFSVSTKRVFEAAVEFSKNMGYHFIAPKHIAIGLFTIDDGNAGRVLKRLGVNANDLSTMAISRLQGELTKDGSDPPPSSKRMREESVPGKVTIDRSSEKARDKSALAQFCVDLTARYTDGLIDPVLGRETEVERIIQILCRKTKCNPILLCEVGVGKTAISEGLAINILEGNVPEFLLTKRILSLDIGLLISGAKERGDLEGSVTTLIKEIKESALQEKLSFP